MRLKCCALNMLRKCGLNQPASIVKLHLIYTPSALLLSKTEYASWRDIQAAFADYQTSLGPWSANEMCAFLHDEYSLLQPAAAVQVAQFVASSAQVCVLSFRGN
jgi:hypothetical protein